MSFIVDKNQWGSIDRGLIGKLGFLLIYWTGTPPIVLTPNMDPCPGGCFGGTPLKSLAETMSETVQYKKHFKGFADPSDLNWKLTFTRLLNAQENEGFRT